MPNLSIIVRAMWDAKAKVWVATSDDVPGLITEADDHNKLARKLKVMVPELLDLNKSLRDRFPPEVPLIILFEHVSKVRLRAA